ncbi:hypothetical protein GCM10011393_32950 [Sphingopyxis bauzanensis]|nr:hypothetical protein GCM10011393_32950 [Sphingopyxis bauzanensis]
MPSDGTATAGGAGGVWLAPISTGAASSAVQNIDRLKRWVIAGILCMFGRNLRLIRAGSKRNAARHRYVGRIA